MFRYPFIQLSRLLDRMDVGGWTMLACGVVIVAATVLTPAWLETEQLRAQRDRLAYQAQLLATMDGNYATLIKHVEQGDPLLLQRLAWSEFQLKTVGTEPICDPEVIQPVHLERWVAPEGVEPPARTVASWHADSRLLRLLTGKPRPWVLAFGAWLILMGLLLNPMLERRAEPPVDYDADDWEEEADEPDAEMLVADAAAVYELESDGEDGYEPRPID